MVLTLLFERCQGHHHREGEAETSTRDQVLEKLDSVEEFKAFSSSLKEPAEYNKLVSTLQNFNDVLFVFLIPAEWFLKESFHVQLKGYCFTNFS